MACVRVMTERPPENSPGAIIEGQYRIAGGLLEVKDTQGHALGSVPIADGDDAKAAARKLLRDKSEKHSEFYAPIPYPKTSIH
jgi:hypothetical protein